MNERLVKGLFKILIATLSVISITAIAMPPTITTKILEVQNWEGLYFFRIENSNLVNPAACAETKWVVSKGLNSNLEGLNETLIDARKDDLTIKLFIGETQYAFQSRFPLVRAVSF